jgi:hypothetical protein
MEIIFKKRAAFLKSVILNIVKLVKVVKGARRNVGLQAMPFMGLGVAYYSQRSTQHKRNAEFSCLVVSWWKRTKC